MNDNAISDLGAMLGMPIFTGRWGPRLGAHVAYPVPAWAMVLSGHLMPPGRSNGLVGNAGADSDI